MLHSYPSESEQRKFWDEWNAQYRDRTRGIDPFMARQAATAEYWVAKCPGQPARILEVGCGTGWLSAHLRRFGEVTGVDLSPSAIEEARARYPGIAFLEGDFGSLELGEGYGFVVSADAIAHVVDQAGFVSKIAAMMPRGGLFLLMTQNPFVWNRNSSLKPQGNGQVRNWPSRRRIRELFRGSFRIIHETSFFPGGDRGVLRVANSYWLNAMLSRAFGPDAINDLRERLFIGRELVVVGERI